MTERNAFIAVESGGCAPPIICKPTAEELIACFRSGQIEADEMVQICRERPDVFMGLRAGGVV